MKVLVLPLADLLMVTDLLTSPSIFWHYAVARWRQTQKTNVIVLSEADALGLFLSDRSLFNRLEEQLDLEQRIYVGPSGQAINDYYTGRERGSSSRKKPIASIPDIVLDSLDTALKAEDNEWKDLVTFVMSEPEKTWNRVRKLRRKLTTARQPRQIHVSTSAPDIEIWIKRDPTGAIQVDVSLDRSHQATQNTRATTGASGMRNGAPRGDSQTRPRLARP